MIKDRELLHKRCLYPVVRVLGEQTIGSGTILYSKPGKTEGEVETYTLTNHHVIASLLAYKKEWDAVLQRDVKKEIKAAGKVEEFRYRPGKTIVVGESGVQSDVVAYDAQQDLALLKLRDIKQYDYIAEMWPRKELMDMLMELYCVGCGLGQRPLMTHGFLSGMGIEIDNYEYMLSSAPSIFGNSGGALFEVDSLKFVGVPSRISVSGYSTPITHMGFFIPISRVYNFLEEQCYQFIYDTSFTPAKCEVLREERREKELSEYKRKVILGSEIEDEDKDSPRYNPQE